MGNTFIEVIVPQGVALTIVFLTFLFNHLSRKKEFRHNEYLKKLELQQRETERKFIVGEKMIDKGIDAHMEAYTRVQEIFGFVNEYYSGEGTLVPPGEEERKQLKELLLELNKWRNAKGFFLDKTVKKQLESIAMLGVLALRTPKRTITGKGDIWAEMWRAVHGLRDALEAISKEYNPLYDLSIRLPEIEI